MTARRLRSLGFFPYRADFVQWMHGGNVLWSFVRQADLIDSMFGGERPQFVAEPVDTGHEDVYGGVEVFELTYDAPEIPAGVDPWGEEPTTVDQPAKSTVPDLMAALQESLRKAKRERDADVVDDLGADMVPCEACGEPVDVDEAIRRGGAFRHSGGCPR